MFKITPQTLGSLEQASAVQWDKQAAATLINRYPEHFQALGASQSDVTALCRIVRERVAPFEIISRRDVLKLSILAVSLGAYFFDDQRFEHNIVGILRDKTVEPEERLEVASESALEWLAYLWGGAGLGDFGKRLATVLSEPEEDFNEKVIVWKMLTFAMPGQMRLLTEDANIRFFADSFSFAQKQGLNGPVLKTAYTACATAHGIRWFDDPQYSHLRSAFETVPSQAELRRALGLFYGKFA